MTRSTPLPHAPTHSPQAAQPPRALPRAVRCAARVQPHGPQRLVREALGTLQRGSLDAAIAGGVLGGLASLAAPQLADNVHALVGAGIATTCTATLAQALQAAFVPDVYLGFDDHLRCADRAWKRGNRARALRHVEFAAAVQSERSFCPRYSLNDRHLAEMVTYAAEQRRWPAVRLLVGSLPTGSRGYWEAIAAAYHAGVADTLPTHAWAEALLRTEALPINGAEAALLTDILVAGPPVRAPLRSWERWLSPGLFACAEAAQAGQLDIATRHRLARLFVEIPQLSSGAMQELAREAGACRQALFVLDDMACAGRLPASQRAAVHELLSGVASALAENHAAFLADVQAFAAGRLTFAAFTLAVAERHGSSPAAHAALARHMLAQFMGGDTHGALATAGRIQRHYDHNNIRHAAMKAVLCKAPQAFRQLFVAAVEAGDEAAVERLLPVASELEPADRLRLLDALRGPRWVERRILFFRDGRLCLRDLSLPRLQAMVATLARLPGLDRDEDAGLRDFLRACGGTLPPEVLRVWLMAARTPEIAGVFRRLAGRPPAVERLKQIAMPELAAGRLSDTGFLLAMHLVDAVPDRDLSSAVDLQEPRIAALLHCHPLLKNTQRARRLLSALAQLGQLAQHSLGEQARRVLLWPDDAQLRPWMQAQCAAARAQQVETLQRGMGAGDGSGAPALQPGSPASHAGSAGRARQRAARDAVELWTENLHLHAAHVHRQGDRENALAYRDSLGADVAAQRAQVQKLSALLEARSDGHALVQAFLAAASGPALDKAGKALNDWRKGRSKALDAELAAQVHAAASLCAQSDRILRQLRKPVPAPAPTDFFTAHAHSKAAQALHHQHLVPLQVEALHALVSIEAFGGGTQCDTPQAMLAEKRRVLQVTDVTQPAFDAMLARFRDPQLFWSFASRMRRYQANYCEAFDATLQHLLAGTHTQQRRASPQMRALFGDDASHALRDAWEAGAWGVVPADQPYAGLRLHDTGAFEDFASSGDEITGSCHSLLHGGYYAYLMGRVVCGSKRMLTIKDATGRMVARAVFRLMLDDHDKPTLLISRTYAIGRDRERAGPVLQAFALARAQALGLPLLHGSSLGRAGGVRVHCKTGAFPEYWDEPHEGDDFAAPLLWAPEARAAA